MINHRKIAKIIEDFEKQTGKNSEVVSDAVYDFVIKYNLLPLLPKSIKHLSNVEYERRRNNSLVVKVVDKNLITNSVLDRIMKNLGVLPKTNIVFEKLISKDAGFVASYNGKVFDGRVSTNAKILLEELKRAI